MRFMIREIAGWILVGLGLYLFYICLMFLLGRQILETGPLTVIGFVVFRGGIHLLKVSVAAQVCLQAQEAVSGTRPRAAARHGRQKHPINRTHSAERVT